MTHAEISSYLLIPAGFIFEWKILFWPILLAGVIWLIYFRITKLKVFLQGSLLIWWIIFFLGSVCFIPLFFAFFGTPQGTDRLPYYALALVTTPVFFIWIIAIFLHPRIVK